MPQAFALQDKIKDEGTNNNLHRLIELCNNFDLNIVNGIGFFALDLKVGNFTWQFGKSCIDLYVLSSPELFPLIENLNVDFEFDPLLSDK